MTITALQKRCDQDDLAVNTEMVLTPFSGDAIRRRPPDHFVGAVAKLKGDSELDLALLDVKHRICGIALGKDGFLIAIAGQGSATIHSGEKCLRVKRRFFPLL